MTPTQIVRAALEGLDCSPTGPDENFTARCPAHDDRNASLQVRESEEGKALVKCYAGCYGKAIVEAMGLRWGDLFPASTQSRPHRREVAAYSYLDENRRLLYQKVRYEPKGFAQRRPGDDGEWVYGLDDVRRVLYRLPQVLEAIGNGESIVIVEGEKDVHALVQRGIMATTHADGAGNWRWEYAESLRGARRVAVIADNDPAGKLHAVEVCASLVYQQVGEIHLFTPAVGKDVSDHLDAGRTLANLVPHDLTSAFKQLEVC